LAPRLSGVDQDFVWVTWDSPQSRSLLDGKNVVFARPTPPRNAWAVSKNLDIASRVWRHGDVTGLVTTGSQFVLPFIVVGRARGRPCHFIESAARVTGLSLTARIASRIPGVHLYTQYKSAISSTRLYVGSVFDGFIPRRVNHPVPIKRIVVTLGTMPTYGFPRLVSAVSRVAPPEAEILWQTGSTDTSALGVEGLVSMAATELHSGMIRADAVVAHAGVGSALAALQAGKCPILVPRSAKFGEHVDEHQFQIAAELAERGLAVVAEADELTLDDLHRASRVVIENTAREASPVLLS
jgi:UDP-N-acetylglucosamine--N-acetylmuramyl-(pentapeptide) pyrophosphoryl-undecaprenol N-acetylglucosamine transferase